MTPRNRESYTVLVVDDDPSVLATYGRLLRKSGYRAVTVQDPCKVLSDGLADNGIDLILLDYKMPGMDGLSLLQALRDRHCRSRCVLVSAFVNDEVRTRARKLEVSRVMEKPVDVQTLRRTLSDLLPLAGPSTGGVANLAG